MKKLAEILQQHKKESLERKDKREKTGEWRNLTQGIGQFISFKKKCW
jgi:hypothetical protein